VLSGFEPENALEVVRRMASLTPPGFEALSSVAASLEPRVREAAKKPVAGDPKVRLKSIAKLLSHSEQAIEKAVLTGLEASDQALALEIREFMFTWSDLAGVDKRGMQKILSSVETRTLAVALKACPVEVEKNILENLSVRVRAMVADERELAGPMPMAEVESARGEIMKSVRALMDAGDFKPSRAGEELVQ
jgi:flagellar motor switch protein FliG